MPSTRVELLVTPGARQNVVERTPEGTLRIRVTAPPVEGKANDAVIKLLAKCLGIPRSRVTIVHGGSGRRKLVSVDGMSQEELWARVTGIGQTNA